MLWCYFTSKKFFLPKRGMHMHFNACVTGMSWVTDFGRDRTHLAKRLGTPLYLQHTVQLIKDRTICPSLKLPTLRLRLQKKACEELLLPPALHTIMHKTIDLLVITDVFSTVFSSHTWRGLTARMRKQMLFCSATTGSWVSCLESLEGDSASRVVPGV